MTALRILERTWAVVSVRRMREFKSGEDFDILEEGSRSERTRHEEAVRDGQGTADSSTSQIDVLITCCGRGNRGLFPLNVRLKLSARSRHSSMCCCWSSPTGTCVALASLFSVLHTRRFQGTYRYASMSAAWRTGYVKSPAFSRDSSTSESSRAFRDAASLD